MAEIARIPLKKPVIGYGGKETSVLVLREPTAAEWWRIGDPYRTIWQVTATGERRHERIVDRPVMREWLRELGGFGSDLHMDQMSYRDMSRAVDAIFFWFIGQNGDDAPAAGADGASGDKPGGPAGNSPTP